MEQQAEEIGWVEQALRGDQAAFGQLMHRYTGAVYNLAYRMLGSAQDAEDASQEIFLRAYTRLSSFDRSRRFSTWLLSIGSNYCIDRLRRRRFAWLTLDDIAYSVPTGRPGPERTALEREDRVIVQRALQQLPENYRLVTVLRYYHDMSYEEIAEATGLPPAEVRTALDGGRRLFERELKHGLEMAG